MRLRSKLILDYYAGGLLHVLLKPPTILAGKILRRDHDLGRCPTVTILKMMGGGSLAIAFPALLGIKGAPGVRSLRIVTSPSIRPFAEALGVFDEIIVIRDDSVPAILRDSVAAFCRLFRTDAIVDLEVHSRLTTVFSLLTCARNRVGFYTGNSFWRRQISTHLLFCNLPNGIYRSYEQVAALFGARIPDWDKCCFRFRTESQSTARAPTGPGLRLALAPCCSELSAERMLKPEEWVRILQRRVAELPIPVEAELHLLGASGDRERLDQLSGLLRTAIPGVEIVNHAGAASLADSIRVLAQMDKLFCIDSALLHFARLLGVPTVSFWGPTDPRWLLRPIPDNRDEIHYQCLACSPCVHQAQHPPCGGNNICMRAAADPGGSYEPNPAWVVADHRVKRFIRSSAP